MIFFGGFVVWLRNLPFSYLYSLGQSLPIPPLGAANVYPVALCEILDVENQKFRN